MVATTLRVVREVADEIVVAVDRRVDQNTLGPLLDVADRVVRFEFVHPPELARPWLIQQCSYSTVMMIDGDEVPSAELVEVLPELVADPDFVQCRVARRWCFPDERHWLAERPWWPDYQRRIVRHGASLSFDLRVHGGVVDATPARYVDRPLYHLACVLDPFSERRRRARRYDEDRRGLVAVGGGPLNDTLYVPEHFASVRPHPTPEADVATLHAVMVAARAVRLGRASAELPVVGAAEIMSCVPVDALDAAGCRASVRIAETDRRTEPGNNTCLVVEVENTGRVPIPHRDEAGAQVRVAARLVDSTKGDEIAGWILTPLPCDVPQGQARIVEAVVPIPFRSGSFVVEVGLINRSWHWLSEVSRADLLVASRWGRYAPRD